MTYVLYGDKGSGSAAVELALAEIGAPVVLRELSLDDEVQRSDDYRSINAQRKLPTLMTPEGEVLTESSAILLTLAERHPEASLLPAVTNPLRAQALRWVMFVATELYPLIEIIDYPERFQPEADETPGERRDAVRECLRRIWKRRWRIVEQAVSEEERWFLGSAFSIVDIYVAVVSRWAQTGDWRPENLPRIEAIAAALGDRPHCEAVWMRHFG